MTKPNEDLRRAKDYIEVKKIFQEDPAGTMECLKERLTGHAQIINLYEKETKKLSINQEQKKICLMGIEETIKSGKMIIKWIGRLKKDFPDYDFSQYTELMKILERKDLK